MSSYMTKQEVFDIAVRGLASQKFTRIVGPKNGCQYNGPDGKHCALGWVILAGHVEISPNENGTGAEDLLFDRRNILDLFDEINDVGHFLQELQNCHDTAFFDDSNKSDSPLKMINNLRVFGASENLDLSVLAALGIGY
jgi:hypothetical protein